MTFRSSAPAKAILFGEHAVVYGMPAVAIPLPSIRAYAEISTNIDDSIFISAPALNIAKDMRQLSVDDPIRYAVELFLVQKKISPQGGLHIQLSSDIPIASGMGSGAAITTALIKALFSVFQLDYAKKELSDMVFMVEKIHHGTPSGIDNTVTCFETAVYYQKNQPIKFINFPLPFHLIIADSGVSTPTRTTVAEVRTIFEQEPDKIQEILEQIRDCVTNGLTALQEGNWQRAGEEMNRNHSLLRELTVSSLELDQIVENAVAAGAYGAKLSGGGRGGIVIALTAEEKLDRVLTAMANAGAASCFHVEIGAE